MYHYAVAPFTGAWIEIVQIVQHQLGELGAPFTGAWIEIFIVRPK